VEGQQNFEDTEDLLYSEFTQAEIEQLIHIRSFHVEKAQKQMLAERRRLEFARWLVLHGRLTDELSTRQPKGSYPRYPYFAKRQS